MVPLTSVAYSARVVLKGDGVLSMLGLPRCPHRRVRVPESCKFPQKSLVAFSTYRAVLPEKASVVLVVVIVPQFGSVELDAAPPPPVAVKKPVSLTLPMMAGISMVVPPKDMDAVIVSCEPDCTTFIRADKVASTRPPTGSPTGTWHSRSCRRRSLRILSVWAVRFFPSAPSRARLHWRAHSEHTSRREGGRIAPMARQTFALTGIEHRGSRNGNERLVCYIHGGGAG